MQKWLADRGLKEEVIGKMGLQKVSKNGEEWIKIPFVHTGEVVNNKYRSLNGKKFFQDSGGKKCFYNFDVISDESMKDEPLIITEGEPDVWAAMQAGFKRVVSVPDGAPNEKGGDGAKYDYLWEAIPLIRSNCPYVILAVDNDKNGDNLLHDLSIKIGKDFCKWVKYPKGCKDLNDSLQKFGEMGVIKSLDMQGWMQVDGVFRASELPPVPEAKVYSTGFKGFEHRFKIRLGDFSVVTGIPSMGKSTFVNDLMARAVQKNGLKVCFASFEQHPTQDHLRNLKRWCAGSNISDADYWIDEYFSFIYPTDEQRISDTLDLAWFLERAAAAVKRFDSDVIVLDPWNELEHTKGGGETMTEYVGSAIRRIKAFAKAYNVHMMVVAHPTKLSKDKDGKYPRPSLYNISDSSHWANKADIGIVVHRPDENTNETEIVCCKSRYHDIIGKPGVEKFVFNNDLNKFEWADR